MRKYSNVVQEDGSRGICGVGPGIYRVSFYEFLSLLAKGLHVVKLFRRCWLETALSCTNHTAFCKCILFRKIRMLLSTSKAIVKIKQHSGGAPARVLQAMDPHKNHLPDHNSINYFS